MRGGVAISVTATPAAAPRRIREVLRIIIREPSGLRLRPTKGLDQRVFRPCGIPHKARVGLPALASADCRLFLRWARPLRELAQLNGHPLHPSEQDMISAAGIKDQELTIIVSMMLIELALSRLSRAAFFKRLALLDTQGLELLAALLPRVWRARRARRILRI